MQRPFYLMAKPSASHCNLRCEYCFYYKTTQSKSICMSDEVLENYIKNYIAKNPTKEVIFIWQGGEPTLCGLNFFKKAVALQKKYANGKTIFNTLQTNGILLNHDWCSFFKENNFLIGISIDGPQTIHDSRRKDPLGNGTFSKILNAIKLLKEYEVEFNTLTVVNKANVHEGKLIYDFLKNIGSTQMQFIPLTGIEENIDSSDYGQFLIDIFDKWYPQDVGKIFVQHIEQWFMAYAGISPTLCIFRPYCGDQLIIEQNGDIFSCDHFVDDEHKLGNIMSEDLLNIINNPTQLRFGFNKSDYPQECKQCSYIKFCFGGCPKHRYQDRNGIVINRFCESYKMALKHMLPYFHKILQELFQQK